MAESRRIPRRRNPVLSEDKYFQTLTQEELWQRYCGFFDLSLDEFMSIQEHLLMEQIGLVAGSPLGKKIMGNNKPGSVEEFRRAVPLTMYDDYEPYLSERQEDVLAVKPYLWCHSAGRRGEFKWIPHSSQIVEKAVRSYLGAFILASASQKGEINIKPGFRGLTVLPPAPYTSGSIIHALTQHISMQLIPPLETEAMEFDERAKIGFQMALKGGVDIIGSLISILVGIGEEFSEQTHSSGFSMSMLHPKVALQFLKAWLQSKREGRTILPRDLWKPKGIVAVGLDATIYRDKVAYYWGKPPYELYAYTEALVCAMQNWNKRALTFLPDMVFLEFIPQEEQFKHEADKNYQPSTVLLNEVEEGKSYEVVITHFYGMPLLRYQTNDVIKVIALKDDEAGINLPQIIFQRKVGEVINLANLAHLDQKTIWQAIANTGIKFADWVATKEYDLDRSQLSLYIELNEKRDANQLANMIDEQLKLVDPDYKDIDSYLHYQPVKVTPLSAGTFMRYAEKKKGGGCQPGST